MKIPIKYWETYSKVFYVEAPDIETAKRIVEENVAAEPELLENVEMESSGYKRMNLPNITDEEWDRSLDFKYDAALDRKVGVSDEEK